MSKDPKHTISLAEQRRHRKNLERLTLQDAIDMITKLHTAVTDLVDIVEKHAATFEVMTREILSLKKHSVQ